MHCRFKSKATGDLILMGEIGDSILRIIGKTPSEKGILQAADLLPRSRPSSLRSRWLSWSLSTRWQKPLTPGRMRSACANTHGHFWK